MANYYLDITKEHCPMTFVRTKIKLSQISSGDILEVKLKKGEPLENVPRSAIEEGHILLETKDLGEGIFSIILQKK